MTAWCCGQTPSLSHILSPNAFAFYLRCPWGGLHDLRLKRPWDEQSSWIKTIPVYSFQLLKRMPGRFERSWSEHQSKSKKRWSLTFPIVSSSCLQTFRWQYVELGWLPVGGKTCTKVYIYIYTHTFKSFVQRTALSWLCCWLAVHSFLKLCLKSRRWKVFIREATRAKRIGVLALCLGGDTHTHTFWKTSVTAVHWEDISVPCLDRERAELKSRKEAPKAYYET